MTVTPPLPRRLRRLDKIKNPQYTADLLRESLDKAVPEEVVRNLSGYIKSDGALKKAGGMPYPLV